MNSKKVRIMATTLAIVLVLAIVFGLVLSIFSPPARAEGKIDSLRKDAQALSDEKQKLQKDLELLGEDRATADIEKQSIDRQIEITLSEIDTATLIIAELNEHIAESQIALDEAMQEESLQMENYRGRIRLMEEAGEARYLGVILMADSFSDLLGRISTVQEIVEYDEKMLQSLKEARLRVVAEKEALEASKTEQEQIKQELSARQAELEVQNARQMELIREIESKEEELREAINEQERLEKAIQTQIQSELAEIARRLAEENKPNVYVGGEFLWPCPGYVRISSEFGRRFHPILKEYRGHSGIDMAAPSGTKILAANGGTVITSSYNAGGYGNYVVINHGGGRATLYAHMSKSLVSVGQTVERGETIGLVGSTGLSTGPHLHFEVIINGVQVNPRSYL